MSRKKPALPAAQGGSAPSDGGTFSPKVERRPVKALLPYARNARKHSDRQIALLASTIREFGWSDPVVVDGAGGIIAGHGRVMAADLLGMTEVPVIEMGHLSATQVKAFRLSHNRLAEIAEWDPELLKLELGELREADFEIEGLGWSDEELSKILGDSNPGLTDPDAAPAPPGTLVTEPHDVWLLGKHRLVCGDACDADDVARALNGVAPHLMITDPPYGVSYDPGWRGRRLQDGHKRAEGKVKNDERADWREAWALFPGDVAYVWHAFRASRIVAESLEAAGFAIRAEIVWAKPHFVVGRGDYHAQHESCWYAVRQGAKGHWAGDRKQSTVWQIDNATIATGGRSKQGEGFSGHGTQKPVECMRRPIENNSSPGQAIFDPFVGSGTSIIAAEMTGRACHALDLDPVYCDVAVLRWQEFTGLAARLEATGQTYAEALADRNPEAVIVQAAPKKPKRGGKK